MYLAKTSNNHGRGCSAHTSNTGAIKLVDVFKTHLALNVFKTLAQQQQLGEGSSSIKLAVMQANVTKTCVIFKTGNKVRARDNFSKLHRSCWRLFNNIIIYCFRIKLLTYLTCMMHSVVINFLHIIIIISCLLRC